MIENWRDLVGYWTNTNPDKEPYVFYLTYRYDDMGKPYIRIERAYVTCDLNEQELCEQLDVILTSFPKGNFPYSDIGKARAGHLVASQTRRGVAKTEYKQSIFYRGTYHTTDTAVFVAERNGKFGIFKHPNFDQYGFTL